MIDTTKITELKKTNRTFPESDKIKQGKNSPSKENAKLGGDAQRAESEIPTDAIGRMNGALRTWEEVAADNSINKAELARLRELATRDPQNDIYHNFLQHVADNLQQQFNATPRSLFSKVGLRLRMCEETMGVSKRFSLHKLFEDFGKTAPKLEAEEEVQRFKELKAMVESDQASVATLLVDASRFKQAETIKATLVLMIGLCKSRLDADLLYDFSEQIVAEQGHREQCLLGKDLAWAFAEACRRDTALDALLLAHRIPRATPCDNHDFGPTLIVEHRKLEEGDLEKIAAVVARYDSEYARDLDREHLTFAAAMLAKGAPLDTAISAVVYKCTLTVFERNSDCEPYRNQLCRTLRQPVLQRLRNPQRYPTAAQEYAKVVKWLHHEDLHQQVITTLEQAKAPTEGLFDLLQAILEVERAPLGKEVSRIVFSALERSFDRQDLTPTQVDRAVEIAQRILVGQRYCNRFHQQVITTLEQAKAPTEGLLDLLEAIQEKAGVLFEKKELPEIVFSAVEQLMDRKDLTPAQVSRAVEIATQTNSDNNKRRVQRILEKAKNCGLATLKAIEKADKRLEAEKKAKRRSKMHSAENLLREVD